MCTVAGLKEAGRRPRTDNICTSFRQYINPLCDADSDLLVLHWQFTRKKRDDVLELTLSEPLSYDSEIARAALVQVRAMTCLASAVFSPSHGFLVSSFPRKVSKSEPLSFYSKTQRAASVLVLTPSCPEPVSISSFRGKYLIDRTWGLSSLDFACRCRRLSQVAQTHYFAAQVACLRTHEEIARRELGAGIVLDGIEFSYSQLNFYLGIAIIVLHLAQK